MNVIAESPWSWMLYAQGEKRWLAVICGSVGLYEMVIELDADERACIANSLDVEPLARAISGAPSHYRSRHLARFFDDDAVGKAIAAWRTAADRSA